MSHYVIDSFRKYGLELARLVLFLSGENSVGIKVLLGCLPIDMILGPTYTKSNKGNYRFDADIGNSARLPHCSRLSLRFGDTVIVSPL